MHPIIQIGPVMLNSYGLMLAIGFGLAFYLFMQEMRRRGMDPELGVTITLISFAAGLVGARLLSLVERWPEFLADPVRMALSTGGLTFHGGLILAILLNYLYMRHYRIRFLQVADCAVPSLLIAYGIARIGCHLAGDGDYGMPASLAWGTDYSQGVRPPSVAFMNMPEIAAQYPGGVVPDNTPCLPTPLYEFLIIEMLFLIFWRIRKNLRPEGQFFMMYLVCAGLERFFIEFLRINPRILFGLTESHIVALVMICVGALGWQWLAKNPRVHEHAG